MARYYLDEEGDVVHFTYITMQSVPFIALNAEQQQQVTKEIGHYSLEKVKEMTKQ